MHNKSIKSKIKWTYLYFISHFKDNYEITRVVDLCWHTKGEIWLKVEHRGIIAQCSFSYYEHSTKLQVVGLICTTKASCFQVNARYQELTLTYHFTDSLN